MGRLYAGLMAILLLGAGCASLGRDFSESEAVQLEIGKTTRAEVEQRLGAPFRVGSDSGAPSATYLYYRVGLFFAPIIKDLFVTYDRSGLVKSFSFNSNPVPKREPEDIDQPGPGEGSK